MLLDEILELDMLTLRDHSQGPTVALDPVQHREALEAAFEKSKYVTIRSVGQLIAYAYLWPAANNSWFVGGLAVHPEHRNGAVFRDLTQQMLHLFSENQIEKIVSNVYKANNKSVRLHQRLGFSITRENNIGVEFTLSMKNLTRRFAKRVL